MADKTHKKPERTCIACRTERGKDELVRFVRLADGSVSLDTTGKARGRGAYVCLDEACFNSVRHGHKLDAALKTGISDEDYQRLSEQFASLIRAMDAQ